MEAYADGTASQVDMAPATLLGHFDHRICSLGLGAGTEGKAPQVGWSLHALIRSGSTCVGASVQVGWSLIGPLLCCMPRSSRLTAV